MGKLWNFWFNLIFFFRRDLACNLTDSIHCLCASVLVILLLWACGRWKKQITKNIERNRLISWARHVQNNAYSLLLYICFSATLEIYIFFNGKILHYLRGILLRIFLLFLNFHSENLIWKNPSPFPIGKRCNSDMFLHNQHTNRGHNWKFTCYTRWYFTDIRQRK